MGNDPNIDSCDEIQFAVHDHRTEPSPGLSLPPLSGDISVPPAFSHMDPSLFVRDTESLSPPSFPRFGELPAELRLRIWEAALPSAARISRTWNNDKFRYSMRRPVPAILQACYESRAALVETHGDGDKSRASFERLRTHGEADETSMYVNWRWDEVWIERGFNIKPAEVVALSRVRRLAMAWGLRPCWVEGAVTCGISFIQQLPQLEVLTLVVTFSEFGWGDGQTRRDIERAKRAETRRIAALVGAALGEARRCDADWSPPQLRVVPKPWS